MKGRLKLSLARLSPLSITSQISHDFRELFHVCFNIITIIMAPAKGGEQTALERDLNEEDEEYDENADEDFNPDQAGGDEEASSSEDEEDSAAAKPVKRTQKRKADAAAAEELDSGDEATIQERKKKRRKKEAAAQDEESGGEAGSIRTRAQRQAEKTERKEKKRQISGEVTIDVEQIWRELSAIPVGRPPPPPPKVAEVAEDEGEEKENAPELVTIKRRIEYAGEVTEVEEQVPRNSKQAQQFFRDHPEADPNYKPPTTADTELRRPLKRPSMFEPNPTATVKGVPPERLRPRAPSRLDVLLAEKKAEEEMRKKAEKMTTVQKSALDWKGFVDSQGLQEELDEYGKSKAGYLAREDFLGRADLAREEMARSARLKG